MSTYNEDLVGKAAEAAARIEHQRALCADVDLPERYARAVLDAVAADLRANAWEEGWRAGRNDSERVRNGAVYIGDLLSTPNPYRKVDRYRKADR